MPALKRTLRALVLAALLPGPGAARASEGYVETLESARCGVRWTAGEGRAGCEWPVEGGQRLTLSAECREGGDEAPGVRVHTKASAPGGGARPLDPAERRALLEALGAGRRIGPPGARAAPFEGERRLLLGFVRRCREGASAREADPWAGGWRTPAALAGIGWVERYSTRPGGPCHWLGLAPVRARTEREGGAAVEYDARTAPHASAPVLLAQCCRATPGEPEQPLSAHLDIAALPGDPPAWRMLNPAHWPGALLAALARGGLHFSAPASARWEDAGGRVLARWEGRLAREAVQYDTESRYTMALDRAGVARALARPGAYTLVLEAGPLRARAEYLTGERSTTFARRCAGTGETGGG